MPFEINRCAMPESDESLLAVYGDDATISRIGLFTLVHLDSPSPETVVQRTSEFDPLEFFFVDDCELCRASLDQGGLFVFACDHPDYAGVHAATPVPAAELLRALDRLDVASEDLVLALEPIASAELLERTIEDVRQLHDRFVESMWAPESPSLPEVFEKQYANAIATLSAVREAHESLAAHVADVTVPLDRVAAIWRSL
ncbi:MAG: hypothetical protein IT175_09855 [Acidobacteria bacterium]|nr:hypothetical protein [Acidobacteriota bacterium]